MKCNTEINFIKPLINQLNDFNFFPFDNFKMNDKKVPEETAKKLSHYFKNIELENSNDNVDKWL